MAVNRARAPLPSARCAGGAALALALLAAACGRGRGGGGDARPAPSLSASVEAQAVFAPLRHAWNDPAQMPPAELRARLEQFLARFGGDGLAPLARVLLAFVYLDARDDARARLMLAGADQLPAGATRDLATVAQAKLLRRQGQPARAYELLQPLVGKLVDAEARGVFGEELTLAALESRHPYEAIAYMDAWLRAAAEDEREATRTKVKAAVARVDADALSGALRAMRAGAQGGGYSAEIQRIVTERLAAVAVERGDSDLARWLVEGARAPVAGEVGDALGELATTKRGLVNVAGRTLGLLLPTRIVTEQDEAAEVIRGLAFALGLPHKHAPDGDELRLATRDAPPESEARDARLDELAGEGVAAIVTGLDGEAADGALRWAEARRVPVLVLAAPRAEKPGAWGFVLGEDRTAQLAAVGAALAARKVTRAAPVTEHAEPLEAADLAALSPVAAGPRGDCEADPENAAASPFPLAEWRKDGVHAWVAVGASAECARKLVRWLSTLGPRPGVVALTLEPSSVVTDATSGAQLVAVGAGAIPVLPGGAEAAEGIAAYVTRLGRPPDWWTALGRDAGKLAEVAFAGLPADITTDEAEVRRRRELARRALEEARAKLWTSEREGFDGHVLRRTLRVVEVSRVARSGG